MASPVDPSAMLAALYAEYQGTMLAAARAVLGTGPDADDAVQNALIKAHRALPEALAHGDFHPGAWLAKIATNAAHDLRRQHYIDASSHHQVRPARLRFVSLEGLISPQVTADHTDGDDPPWAAEVSEQRAIARALIGIAFLHLPAAGQRLIWLREYDGLSYRALADRLGRTVPAVKSDLYRLRRLLAAAAEREQRLARDHCGVAARFWAYVRRPTASNPEACWGWTGGHQCYSGAAAMHVATAIRKTPGQMGAVRISWTLAYGPPPPGVQIRHMLGNPECTNPHHLFAARVRGVGPGRFDFDPLPLGPLVGMRGIRGAVA